MSFLFRAASRFSLITLKAILPTFSQPFWSEIRNKPHVSINHLPKEKNDWAGHHWSTQTAQITLWTLDFIIIHCVKLAFNCRKGCWDFLSLTYFYWIQVRQLSCLVIQASSALANFCQTKPSKIFTHSSHDGWNAHTWRLIINLKDTTNVTEKTIQRQGRQ